MSDLFLRGWYWYDPWQFIFRSGYLTEVNWINDSKFSLTFINRLQTRFTLILCQITREMSSVCSKASGSLSSFSFIQKSPGIIYLISLFICMQLSHQDGLDENPHGFQLTPSPSPFLAHKNKSLFIFVPAARNQILMKNFKNRGVGHNLRQTELLSDNFAEVSNIECWDYDREIM